MEPRVELVEGLEMERVSEYYPVFKCRGCAAQKPVLERIGNADYCKPCAAEIRRTSPMEMAS